MRRQTCFLPPQRLFYEDFEKVLTKHISGIILFSRVCKEYKHLIEVLTKKIKADAWKAITSVEGRIVHSKLCLTWLFEESDRLPPFLYLQSKLSLLYSARLQI
jgi:hypothetical protein